MSVAWLVGASRGGWVAQHEREVVVYIRGYLSGLNWLFEPINKSEGVLLILRSKLRSMSKHLASKSYDILHDPKDGFAGTAALNSAGVRTVLSLRCKCGILRKHLKVLRNLWN
jgi:hypothetical protein